MPVSDRNSASSTSGTTIKQLVEGKQSWIADLRDACVAQKELWRQIPEWAYRANGRSGYSDCYAIAWRDKVWRIQSSANIRVSGYTVFVNLTTGEPVGPLPPYTAPASHYFLAACDPTDFDAEAILAGLKEEAAEPFAMEQFRTAYAERMWKTGIADWVR